MDDDLGMRIGALQPRFDIIHLTPEVTLELWAIKA